MKWLRRYLEKEPTLTNVQGCAEPRPASVGRV